LYSAWFAFNVVKGFNVIKPPSAGDDLALI
jgi:hypothetical protein